MSPQQRCSYRGYLLSYPPRWEPCQLPEGHEGDHEMTAAGVTYRQPRR